MAQKQKHGAVTAVPTKHEEGIEPIITQIDVLRNPVFSLKDVGEKIEEARQYGAGGNISVKVENQQLSAHAADVFHMLVHLAKQDDFVLDDQVLYFVTADVLRAMGWDQSGYYYNRFSRCLDELTNVRITFVKETENGTIDGNLQFFHSKIIFKPHKGKDDGQLSLYRSQISLTPLLLQICRKGRLKPIHPVYYKLHSRISKRLLELISAYASDLSKWEIDCIWLRDMIPLEGKKYKHAANVKDNLGRALKKLDQLNVIHAYEFEKRGRQWFAIISPNHDYLYSRAYPVNKKRRRKTADDMIIDISPELTTIRRLVEYGINEATSRKLIDKHGEDLVEYQIEHLEYLIKQERNGATKKRAPKNHGGWLVKAITSNYMAPRGFKTQEEINLEKKTRVAEKEAQDLFSKKQYSKAVTIAEQYLGNSPTLEEILQAARQKIDEEKNSKLVDDFVKSLSKDQAAKIHKKTVIELKKIAGNLGTKAIKEGITNPIYAGMFEKIAAVQFRKKKTG
ncbi:MAG: replication initiation protein [Proteobacteria bacterium]|nr:replication initiation protein [Pseudomonadota bacterium]